MDSIAAIFAFVLTLLFWIWFAGRMNSMTESAKETNRLLALMVHEQNRTRRAKEIEENQP